MPHLTRTDRWLLWTLLPLCALVLTLHVREVARTGLAHPPIFVRPPAGDAYPVVGGQRRERGMTWNDLKVGDRLIRVGEADLRGVGYIGFDAIALEQAGSALRTPLIFERDGVRGEIELLMPAHTIPWYRTPFMLFLLGTALLVLLRSPGSRTSQLFFAACGSFVIFQAPFAGGPRIQSYLALGLFNFGGPVSVFLLYRWLIAFPPDVFDGDRLSPRWAWLALTYGVVRIPYLFATPVSSAIVPVLVVASDLLLATIAIAIATWNYTHATPIGRRRMRWGLFGAYVAVAPMVLALLFAMLAPYGVPELAFHRVLQYCFLAAVAFPIGTLIGIARYNMFDVDRLISSAAAYSVSVVLLLGASFAVVPVVAGRISEAASIGETPLLIALSLSLAGVAVPVSRRLRPQIDRVFFPDRRAVREGIERLLRDLSQCTATAEILRLVRDRLISLLRPESCYLLRRTEGGFSSGTNAAAEIGLRSPLVLELEGNPSPLSTDTGGLEGRVPDLPAVERRFLESAGVRLLVPIRRGKDLAGIVCLGARRSGDVYTTTDLGLLATVSERASAEVSRLRDEHAIALERLRADELQTLKDQAEKLNAARSRFLAAASHDLRQPLHALGLFVETLAERVDGAEDSAIVGRMRRSTHGLGEMLDSLLDMSRLDAGALEARVTDFDLTPVLVRLASELEAPAAQKGLAVVREATDAHVRSDPVLVARVVQNLLTNAVRYADSGEVRIRCTRDAGDVLVAVSDTGPGIPEERQAEIFGEFVQLPGTKSGEGLGLGLSIVDRMCELLGHELRLDSKPGVGSTFTLRLPAAPPEVATAAPALPTDLAGRLIVVLDDDLQILEGTGSLLRQWGARVVLGVSEDEALGSLERLGQRPDAILVDQRLQASRTGLEALGKIRSVLGAEVPAAVISGETTTAELATIRASGLPYLAKPVPPAKLRAVLLELLRDR